MKPVLIFRHVVCEGPGYLANFLDAQRIPWKLIKVDEGEAVPDSPDQASALVFMGGPMSVNDDLPWLEREFALIRTAHAQHKPVLGHCLGGQLISKALGGVVTRNPVAEVGWFPLTPVVSDETLSWIADLDFSTEIFHWHGETFTLPDGAIPLFRSKYCSNQGFALGNTLALQCHVEVSHADVLEWCRYYNHETAKETESVQSVSVMLQKAEQHAPRLQQFANSLYQQWARALKK